MGWPPRCRCRSAWILSSPLSSPSATGAKLPAPVPVGLARGLRRPVLLHLPRHRRGAPSDRVGDGPEARAAVQPLLDLPPVIEALVFCKLLSDILSPGCLHLTNDILARRGVSFIRPSRPTAAPGPGRPRSQPVRPPSTPPAVAPVPVYK